MESSLGILARLAKVRIAALTTLSAAAGFLLFARAWSPLLATVCGGVFLLACGACALNQVQEWRVDALMERTKSRPVPSGRIRPRTAFWISVLLMAGGLAVIVLWTNVAAAALGLAAVTLYNGAYPYLKRRTAFAAVPGAFIGALPPVIGWAAAGGRVTDPRVLVLAFFFFVWQVPHFWVQLFANGDDYRRAGLPSLTERFTRRQLARVSFIWTLTTAASCLLLPFYRLNASPWISLGLIAACLLPVWHAMQILRTGEDASAFRGLNIFALLVLCLLLLDPFL